MGGRQQFSERLAPHHVGTRGGVEPVGRVGLPALELQDGQRPLITFDVFAHPGLEATLVDPVPLLDRFSAGKLLVVPDAFGHVDAPSIFSGAPFLRTPPYFAASSILMVRRRLAPSPDDASHRLENHEARFRPASFET